MKEIFATYRKLIITVALIGGALFAGYEIFLWSRTQTTDNAYVEADMTALSSEIGGVVKEILVEENNHVQQGQIIAKLDDQAYKLKLEAAQASKRISAAKFVVNKSQLELAEIERSKAQELVDFHQENLEVIEKDYQRTTRLRKGNFASLKNLDNVEIAYEKAKHDLNQAKLDINASELKLQIAKQQYAIAENEVEAAETSYQLAQRDLINTEIKAPISGIFANNALRQGNVINAGQILAAIVPLDNLYIKANFKENQLASLKAGMRVKISIDAYPKSEIIGRIALTAPATGAKFSLLPPSNATGNFTKIVQRVPVRINFTLPPHLQGLILPGMSSYIQVRTDQDHQ